MNTKTHQYRFMKNESINNIFRIGSRYYFENPTTDLLSFYINPDNEHPFNDIILKALLKTLSLDIDTRQLLSITREQYTFANKRIDLIIEFDKDIVVIETKIKTTINNPFDSYDEYIDTKYYNKNKHRFVLTPKYYHQYKNWENVNYELLLKNIDDVVDFEELLLNYPNNKWVIFFKEYLINLYEIVRDKKFKIKYNNNAVKNNSIINYEVINILNIFKQYLIDKCFYYDELKIHNNNIIFNFFNNYFNIDNYNIIIDTETRLIIKNKVEYKLKKLFILKIKKMNFSNKNDILSIFDDMLNNLTKPRNIKNKIKKVKREIINNNFTFELEVIINYYKNKKLFKEQQIELCNKLLN